MSIRCSAAVAGSPEVPERAGSWLVGDTEKDVAAGRAAGVRPALVATGWAGRERGAAGPAGGGPRAEEIGAGVVHARDLLEFAEELVRGGAS